MNETGETPAGAAFKCPHSMVQPYILPGKTQYVHIL